MNTRFYNAKILTTKEDESFEIVTGELWVEGKRITQLGDVPADTKAPEKWDREIDCKGNLLMPGFKNAHAHTAMVFLRSYADDVSLQEWLYNQVFPKEDQLTEQIVYDLDILGIMEYLTSGITTSFEMYWFPPVNARAAVDCGFRMAQVPGINDYGGTIEQMKTNLKLINEMSDLTTFMVGLHAEYTCQPSLIEDVAEVAHTYKQPVFMHNAETALEVKECIDRHGMTPTQLFDKLGIFEYGGGAYHCVYLDDRDIEIFKEKKISAIHCPASNMKLASGMMPLKRYVDEGINVAIGTDGAASNNSLDMFKEMYLASTMAKIREMDPMCVPAEKILYMATTGSAKAMYLEDCDRLAVGKLADIIMIDLHQPNMQPENNIVKNIVYSGSKQNVAMTMVNGKILYENGIFNIGFDPEAVYARANEIIRGMK